MTDEKPHRTGALTDLQYTRIDFARRDLEYSRGEDLDQLPPAGLVLLIEKLRGRLDDILGVIAELTDEPASPPPDNSVTP